MNPNWFLDFQNGFNDIRYMAAQKRATGVQGDMLIPIQRGSMSTKILLLRRLQPLCYLCPSVCWVRGGQHCRNENAMLMRISWKLG